MDPKLQFFNKHKDLFWSQSINKLLLKLTSVVVVQWNCVSHHIHPLAPGNQVTEPEPPSPVSWSLEHHTFVQFSGIPAGINTTLSLVHSESLTHTTMRTILKLVIFITLSHCTYAGATWRSWRHTARKPWGLYKNWFLPTAHLFVDPTWTSTLTTIIILNWPMSSSVKGTIPAFSFTPGKFAKTVLQYSAVHFGLTNMKI